MNSIEILSKQLIKNQLKLVTAESCTGGLIAKQCTDLSGSSLWFERGFVSYSNAAKTEMLAVKESLIEQYGAVSQQVAKSMAKGALHKSHASISVSVTGIAGPSGGTVEKPVGTVWIAWAMRENLISACYLFEGDREQVREKAALKAIEGLIKLLKTKPN